MDRKANSGAGFSLLEVMVALGLTSLFIGLAVLNMRNLNSRSEGAAAVLAGYLKEVRARALASTSAYRIVPSTSNRIIAQYARTCSATNWTNDPVLVLDLPSNTSVTTTTWGFCYSSRGLPDANVTITVVDENAEQRGIEVMLGGAVRLT